MKQHKILKNYIYAIKQGLILAVPFLMVGSFSLVLNSLPVPAYQAWLSSFAQGRLSELFTLIYDVTLNALAFLLTVTISYSYGRIMRREMTLFFILTSLCSYLAFTGFPASMNTPGDNIFAPEWVFSAMCIALLSCSLFHVLYNRTHHWNSLHTVGGNYHFNLSTQSVVASSVTIFLFALSGELLVFLLGNRNLLNFGSYFFLLLFQSLGSNLPALLLYIFFSHFLWFFGIHGTNTLEAVSTTLFEQNIALNQLLIAAGEPASHIFSKTFLDVFVFMGGCGSALCFITALLVVSKNYPNRKLAKLSALPVFFNISEPLVFGFPIIFNPTMVIPFICTPIVLALTSTAAMKLGLVPMAVTSVGWTVPVPFSGMIATGSIAGSILQIFNLIIGACIYIPFVKRSEQIQIKNSMTDIHRLESAAKAAEQQGQMSTFLDHDYEMKHVAQTMIMDINHTMDTYQIQLYYQPQIHADGSVRGAEALLRWRHPLAGFIYPPLIIMLAREDKKLDTLGMNIIEHACQNMEQLWKQYKKPFHISVNVCPEQLNNPDFVSQVQAVISRYDWGDMTLIFEFTEQIALASSPAVEEQLRSLQSMGIQISMDDFGMGHGSVLYMNNSLFNEVKLDGSLTRQLLENDRSKEIVQSITNLSKALDFDVVAEYVETEEQIEVLKTLNCYIYQGYYYSPPLTFENFIEYIKEKEES